MARLSIIRLAIVPLLLALPFAHLAAAQGLQDLSQTRDRPLFVPGRRPAPPPVPAVAPVAAPVVAPIDAPLPRPAAILLGVVKGPDHDSAIMKLANASKPTIAHLGDSVEGWLVAAITERSIILSNSDDIFELQLQLANERSTSSVPVNNIAADQPGRPRPRR